MLCRVLCCGFMQRGRSFHPKQHTEPAVVSILKGKWPRGIGIIHQLTVLAVFQYVFVAEPSCREINR